MGPSLVDRLPADFREGTRDTLPVAVSVLPYGLVVGSTAAAAGFSVVQATSLSLLVNAGSSQLAAIELLGNGAPLAVVVLTALVINARLVMYSASLAPHFREEPTSWRAVLAFLIIDPVYAMASLRFDGDASVHRRWYYLGLAAPLFPAWVASTAVGAVVGALVPSWLPLSFAVPMVFLALVIQAVKDRPGAAAAGTGATVAVVGAGLPLNLGLLAGAVAGVAAGLFAARSVPTDGGAPP